MTMQYGYRMSKAALNAAGATLARDLRADDIHVAIIHPGAVRLQITCYCPRVCPTASSAFADRANDSRQVWRVVFKQHYSDALGLFLSSNMLQKT